MLNVSPFSFTKLMFQIFQIQHHLHPYSYSEATPMLLFPLSSDEDMQWSEDAFFWGELVVGGYIVTHP